MPWWGWIVLGALLLGTEMLLPTDFYLVFLGLSALVVGLVGLAGLDAPIWGQWALFGILSATAFAFFRRRVRGIFREQDSDSRVDDTLVGEIATAKEPLRPDTIGQVELRGSTWTARNDDERLLEAGSRCRVERVEGLLLHVRKESPPQR